MTGRFEAASDIVLDELRQRRQELMAEIAQIDAAIRSISQFRVAGDPSAAQRSLPGLDLRDLTYADAAELVLQRADRQPLTTKIMLKRLDVGGRPVRGADPYRILYRSLMKDRRFKTVRGRWGLADWYADPQAGMPQKLAGEGDEI